MPEICGTKTTLDVTIYYRGIYYRRFVTVAIPSKYMDGMIGFHTYPSTPGTTWEGKIAQGALGSTKLTHTHTYRSL